MQTADSPRELVAEVLRITYQNPVNDYVVLRARDDGTDESVTIVGILPEIHSGGQYTFKGGWVEDPKYGRQFRAQFYEERLPHTTEGIQKYLSSGAIAGIGEKKAKEIVERFGDKTLEILDEQPERLMEVNGIGKKILAGILESWEQQHGVREVMVFLESQGISPALSGRIYKEYGADSMKVLRRNPYKLADDMRGVGFQTADTIATRMGFDHNHPERLRSGLLYVMNQLGTDGHCFALREQLLTEGSALLGVDPELLGPVIDRMCEERELLLDEDAIYLPSFYKAESDTAHTLLRISHEPPSISIGPEDCLRILDEQNEGREPEERIQYDALQLQAIQSAVSSKVLILTGGPGTGKTTTTLGIITVLESADADIRLAAPTGRAAKRLSEATGLEAKTIHRLLEATPEGYMRGASNPLEGDVLIIDECSMIDIHLMHHLLRAVPDTMSLIFVGDIDQLPSVGPGNVLRDLIDSDCFPVVRLHHIFRQALTSRIILNAHRINEGQLPDISNGLHTDFFFLERNEPELALQTIVELVQTKLSGHYGVPAREIQVLAPMQRGLVGTLHLNAVLQAAINPPDPHSSEEQSLRRGDFVFRAGDKVMQIHNNYQKDVFNGDIGYIQSIDLNQRTLTVSFDSRLINYASGELDELVLAYATTIHKAQGSEYPIVVIPLMTSHYVMLQRNLLYTGITRAKQVLVIVGMRKALARAVYNVTFRSRNTRLKERLRTGQEKYLQRQKKWQSMQARSARPESPASDVHMLPPVLQALSRSSFRGSFALREPDLRYIQDHGLDTVSEHARRIVTQRLGPAVIPNDGQQTPMRGHPVYVAMHATATASRSSLENNHHIPTGKALTDSEIDHIVDLIMQWIQSQLPSKK